MVEGVRVGKRDLAFNPVLQCGTWLTNELTRHFLAGVGRRDGTLSWNTPMTDFIHHLTHDFDTYTTQEFDFSEMFFE